MTATATLSSKYQIVIPQAAREALSLSVGDELLVLRKPDRVVIIPKPKKFAKLGHVDALRYSSSMNTPIDNTSIDYGALLDVAIAEARQGLAEGGIPIGAALFDIRGTLLGCGHNRRVQENDPSVHGETDAFRKAGRQRRYQDTIMVTTLAPCWYCSGLIVQFRIGKVVVGESRTFRGGIDWLRERGVEVIDLDSSECVSLLTSYIAANPDVWNEDIGES